MKHSFVAFLGLRTLVGSGVFFRPPPKMALILCGTKQKKSFPLITFQIVAGSGKYFWGLKQMKNWLQSRVFEVLGEKSCCSRSFSGLLLTAECRGPMLYGVTHTNLGDAGHCSSQKAIRVFSRKGNYYTQVSSKHARNLSLANFWISFFRFAPLPDALNDSMVKLTVVVVIFYGPTIIKSIIFGLSPPHNRAFFPAAPPQVSLPPLPTPHMPLTFFTVSIQVNSTEN